MSHYNIEEQFIQYDVTEEDSNSLLEMLTHYSIEVKNLRETAEKSVNFITVFEKKLKQATDKEMKRINLIKDLKQRIEKYNAKMNNLNQELERTEDNLREERRKTSNLEVNLKDLEDINRRLSDKNDRLQDNYNELNRKYNEEIKSKIEENHYLTKTVQELKRKDAEIKENYERELKDLEDESLKKIQKLNNKWTNILDDHKKTTSDTIHNCKIELEKITEERNMYYNKAKELITNLNDYKKEIGIKAMAKIGNGYRNIITGFQLDQAKVADNEKHIKMMKRPESPNHIKEYMKALETTSSTCDSLSDDMENVPPPTKQRRQTVIGVKQNPRSCSLATRFQSARNTRR